jgi:hypothetical protein
MRTLLSALLGLIGALVIDVAAHAQVNPVYRQNPVTGDATQQQQITVPSGFGLTLQSGASLTCQTGANCGGIGFGYLPLTGGTITGPLTFSDGSVWGASGVSGPSNTLSIINGTNAQTIKVFTNGNDALSPWLQISQLGGVPSIISNWNSGAGAPLYLGAGNFQWKISTAGTLTGLSGSELSLGGDTASNLHTTVNGTACTLGASCSITNPLPTDLQKRVWGYLNSACAIQSSQGVASAVNNTTGQCTVTFSTAFTSATSYSCTVSPYAGGPGLIAEVVSATASSVVFGTSNSSAQTYQAGASMFHCFGT